MEKIGILGPRGTHSESAAIILDKFLKKKSDLVIYRDIFEIFVDVEEKKIDAGLVPVENSIEGAINITLDTLAQSNSLIVTRELVYPIHNCLVTKKEISAEKIKKIFSHAQPISQCRKYLHEKFFDVEIINAPSTARAAEIISESKIEDGFAAICSRRAAELNNLKILAENIQDNPTNRTRFFEIRRREKILENLGEKMLIICRIDGKRAGALYEILGEFAHRNVNMTRIESRPSGTELGEYIFFFDLETNVEEKILQESIDAVRKKSIWLKNLGRFSVINCEVR